MTNNHIIETKNLDFYYANMKALHDINVDFEKNKITTIVGPSGSGKSTLLRVLNRIYSIYPQQKATGDVLFHQKNILEGAIDLGQLRRHMGMVFQKATPFPMSIFDNIAFALRTHYKMSRQELEERVESALKKAALWNEVKDHLKKAGSHLSGGQQQRLCFARTIAMEPEVLLLDEPTSALDPISSKHVQDLIETLKENYTIILVTHNLTTAYRLSDKIIFMKSGKVIEIGDNDKMFFNADKEETKEYFVLDHIDQPNN